VFSVFSLSAGSSVFDEELPQPATPRIITADKRTAKNFFILNPPKSSFPTFSSSVAYIIRFNGIISFSKFIHIL
jgi:hypothetical protein